MELIHLVGFNTKKFVTMHGQMNVKFKSCHLTLFEHKNEVITCLLKVQNFTFGICITTPISKKSVFRLIQNLAHESPEVGL